MLAEHSSSTFLVAILLVTQLDTYITHENFMFSTCPYF